MQVGHVREFPRGMHGMSAARPLAIIHLSCVALGANKPDTIDIDNSQYLDALLASQTARKASPSTVAKSGNRKMADCPSYY